MCFECSERGFVVNIWKTKKMLEKKASSHKSFNNSWRSFRVAARASEKGKGNRTECLCAPPLALCHRVSLLLCSRLCSVSTPIHLTTVELHIKYPALKEGQAKQLWSLPSKLFTDVISVIFIDPLLLRSLSDPTWPTLDFGLRWGINHVYSQIAAYEYLWDPLSLAS